MKRVDLIAIKKRWSKSFNDPYARELQSVLDAEALIAEVEAMRYLERAARGLKAHISPAHRCSSECKMIAGVLEALAKLPPLPEKP